MLITTALMLTTLVTDLPTAKPPLHQQIEDSAKSILAPNTANYPKGYGQVTCGPAEDISSDKQTIDTAIECGTDTTCGTSGILFLFRTSLDSEGRGTGKPQKLLEEPTSDYMGGYYETWDVDDDGTKEILIVSGTDGVAASLLSIKKKIGNVWQTMDSASCGKPCQAQDYVFVKQKPEERKTLMSIRGCELDRGYTRDCEVLLSKITVIGNKTLATEVSIGIDQSSNDLIDSVVQAVVDPNRKDADRATDTLRFLAEIYDKHGLRKPAAIEKVKLDAD